MSKFLFITIAFFLISPVSMANKRLDSYKARLSKTDHQNIQGIEHGSAAAVIRQDRANYHSKRHRDPEDGYDYVFSDHRQRLLMERNLTNGRHKKGVEKRILQGTPLIQVDVYPAYIDVRILSDK